MEIKMDVNMFSVFGKPEMFFEDAVKGEEKFKLEICDASVDEFSLVSLSLKHTGSSYECDEIFMEFSKKEAMFLGKSLIAMAENLEK